MVAALALYRDWTPFGMFLVATTPEHALFGVFGRMEMYDHPDAMKHLISAAKSRPATESRPANGTHL